MGSLTPGATYIYERSGNTVYAREFGKTERTPVGWYEDFKEATEWDELKKLAKDHSALQNSLNNTIMLYKIIRESQNEQS